MAFIDRYKKENELPTLKQLGFRKGDVLEQFGKPKWVICGETAEIILVWEYDEYLTRKVPKDRINNRELRYGFSRRHTGMSVYHIQKQSYFYVLNKAYRLIEAL